MAQQWPWKRSSRKKSSPARRRKRRPLFACCWRRSPTLRSGRGSRSSRTAGQRQDAAELLAAAQHACIPMPSRLGEAEVEEAARRSARPQETRAAVDSHRRVRRRAAAEADRMPTLRREALGQRPRTAAASGVGIAGDQGPSSPSISGTGWCVPAAARRRVPSCPPGVPQGQSGPRLMAFTALLMAYYRQSKRRTAEFLDARSWVSRVALR